MKLFTAALLCFLVLSPHSLLAQEKTTPPATDSVRTFVQGFYDWYAPRLAKDKNGSVYPRALKEKASAFSPDLLHALKEDLAAQSKSKDEIVGLDFDPFLNSQDPAPIFKVGKITQGRDSYHVDVHAVSNGKPEPKPSVTAIVVNQKGQWIFADFHYPEGENLLHLLRQYKNDREKPHPKQ